MKLRRVTIQGYKNFVEPVVLDKLGDINVLHGDNNVGKSNLLEAIGLAIVAPSLASPNGRAAFAARGYDPTEIFTLGAPRPIVLEVELALSADEAREVLGGASLLDFTGGVAYRVEIAPTLASVQVQSTSTTLSEQGLKLLTQWLGSADPRRYDLLKDTRVLHALSRQTTSVSAERLPQDLLLRLYDSKNSIDNLGPWRAFAESLSMLSDTLGEGELVPLYDRSDRVAHLAWESRDASQRIPVKLLGTGIQQIIGLVGHLVLTQAPVIAVEEPEVNIRHPLQRKLREILQRLVQQPTPPNQLFLSSHSPAFESGTHFYRVFEKNGIPTVERRPRAEAPDVLGLGDEAGKAPRPPRAYVSSDGLLDVPDNIRSHLGVLQGGGVVFNVSDRGTVELLSNEQAAAYIEDTNDAESA